MKFRDVEKGIENCALAWVVRGETFRDLTPAEAIAARNKQAFDREPLAYAEIHGLRYEPQAGGESAHRESRLLAYEAHLLVAECSA